MKIAIPTLDGKVDNHFGHCKYFSVFELNEEKQIVSEFIIPSLEGCGCKSGIAPILKEKGINIMLAGNMGDGAVNVLANNDIRAIRGCQGDVKVVLSDFIQGKIKDNQISCSHNCNDK